MIKSVAVSLCLTGALLHCLKEIVMSKFAALFLALLAVFGSTSASAAAIDVTAVVTDIQAQATPIGLVGGAVLIIYAAVKAFRWVRSAMA